MHMAAILNRTANGFEHFLNGGRFHRFPSVHAFGGFNPDLALEAANGVRPFKVNGLTGVAVGLFCRFVKNGKNGVIHKVETVA